VAICKALQRSTTMKSLNLWGNGLGRGAAEAVGRLLEANDTLEILDIGLNVQLGDFGAEVIAEVLPGSKLRSLSLKSTGLRDAGVAALAGALQRGAKVDALHLAANNMTDDGAAALGRALGSNPPLRTLNIAMNKFTSEGARMILEGMRSNENLAAIPMRGNTQVSPLLAAEMAAVASSHSRWAPLVGCIVPEEEDAAPEMEATPAKRGSLGSVAEGTEEDDEEQEEEKSMAEGDERRAGAGQDLQDRAMTRTETEREDTVGARNFAAAKSDASS
jgi:Ran GTPase-activating protein (RanGAP) involved in mRNA processing and transport